MKKILGLACLCLFTLSVFAEYERYEVTFLVRLNDGTELITYYTDYGSFIGDYNQGDTISGWNYPQYEESDSILAYTCRIEAVHDKTWEVADSVYLPVEQRVLSRKDIKNVVVVDVKDVYLWLSILKDMYTCEDKEWIGNSEPLEHKFYYYEAVMDFGFHVYIYEYSPKVKQVIKELDQFQEKIKRGDMPEPYSDSFFRNEEIFVSILHKLKGEKVLIIRISSD